MAEAKKGATRKRSSSPRKKVAPVPPKKIALLGTTPTRFQAPIEDDTWTLWTIGPGGKDSHRWDALFEIHQVWPADFADYLNDLSKVEPPQKVISMQPMPQLIHNWAMEHASAEEPFEKWLEKIEGDWKANVVYPRSGIIEKYRRRIWFSSSISWLLALAMEELHAHPGEKHMGLWGIDLESGEEYVSQWTGCAHLIDLAVMTGINVHLPHGTGLERDVNPYPDRYETHLALTLEKKYKWLEGAVEHQTQQLEEHKAEGYRWEGRLRTLEDGNGPEELKKEAGEKVREYNIKIAQLTANVNHLKGEKSATQFYRRMYVWGMIDPDE